MRTRRIGLALALLGAACGGDSGGGGATFDSPADLAEELGCADTFEPDDAEDENTIDLGLPTFGEVGGECSLGDETYALSVYPTTDDADQAVNAAETVGCSFAEAFGLSELYFVAAGNWNVSVASGDGGSTERVALEPVASALDDEVTTIEC